MGSSEQADDGCRTVEVDDSGRITIPSGLRDQLGIRPGDTLSIEVTNGSLVVHPEQTDLVRVTSGKTDWGPEAFPDSGEATFGDTVQTDE